MVVPTVLIHGPLALLAVLFPAAFGGWKRWLALMTTATTNVTLLTLQWWFASRLIGSPGAAPLVVWSAMGVVCVAGVAWSWQRHARRVRVGEAPLLASGAEFLALLITGAAGLAALTIGNYLEQPLLSLVWLPVMVFTFAVWVGWGYVAWTWLRGARLVPAVATEAVVLTALAMATVAVAPVLGQGGRAAPPSNHGAAAELVWTFRLPANGAIASSPVVAGDRVLIAAAIDSILHPYGALYCLDRTSGAVLWSFDDGKGMRPVFSTPAVDGESIYIGEGFHQDANCKVFCLGLRDGKKKWEYQAASHTEATAAVSAGRVYMGAGDDGLLCLTADRGVRVWRFGGVHIDAGAAVVTGRVYVGCGVGDVYKSPGVICLDAASGKPMWRVATTLPVWSKPVVSSGFVYVGAGNGRLNEAADRPAGEMICLRERDGETVWRKKLSDGVLGSLSVDREQIYFGCRDGGFYSMRRANGETVWRRDLGGPIIAGPAMGADRLYAATYTGTLACMKATTGECLWSVDLTERTKVPIELIATPALEARDDSPRLYVGITCVTAARVGELHCYSLAAFQLD